MLIERENKHSENRGNPATRINRNTQFISLTSVNPEDIPKFVTPKVRNRLLLNQMGLNGLATTIVEKPTADSVYTPGFLKNLLDYSNLVNAGIGLPEASDLIIRSSFSKPVFNHTPRFSDPSVLVTHADTSDPHFRALFDGRQFLPELNRMNYYNYLAGSDFLMVHDDNVRLQLQSMHGRIVESGNRNEIIIASGVLHSRNLAENNAQYPHIIISPDHLDELSKIDPGKVASKITGDNCRIDSPRMEMVIKKCTPHQAYFMLFKLLREQGLLREALRRCRDRFGPECVTEFRSYNLLDGGIGHKIHILDVNTGF